MSTHYTQLSPTSAIVTRIKQFFTVFDERFEDYQKNNPYRCAIRDILAAMIVALVAIPLGVGFSIASGMRPEEGIIAGAVAGIVGGFFGGSKYQVYGPTAAFITTIAGIVHQFDVPFLILSSMLAGIIITFMGVFGLGRYFKHVPHSVIVGFTIGIACTIVISQLPDALGAHGIKISHETVEKIKLIPKLFQDANAHALLLAVFTFYLTKTLYKVSIYIPAPLIAISIGAFIANMVWHDSFIPLIATKYGDIGHNMFQFTPPSLGEFSILDLAIPVTSIVFIAALESLLSSRMADRLANNPTPYNPDKELFGQGLVNTVVPLLNGFPCTGALARTATSIKVGAVSPLSSVSKGISVIVLMVFFATHLQLLPMSCVAGLLIFVASNMVKKEEIELIRKEGWLEVTTMLYTAVMTIATNLLIAVMTATVLYYAVQVCIKKKRPPALVVPLRDAEESLKEA